MEFVWVVRLLVLAAVAGSSLSALTSPKWPPYAFQDVLSESATLFWTPNRTTNEIVFEIQVRTRGYVGFGLAPGDGMAGADLVVGGVKDGKQYFQDMHAVGNSIPLVDAKQNWKLLNAEEKDNITALRFSRPLDTGDCDDDRLITDDTTFIIWAFSDSDELSYHGTVNRGEKSTQLLDNSAFPQANPVPADVKTFEMRMPNATIPASKTTLYWCQAFQLPTVTSKHHIIKYDLLMDKTPIVHHIIVHGCYSPIKNASLFKVGYDCYDGMPEELNCPGSIMGWAVGGDFANDFPPQAGISLGTAEDVKFVVFEMHYNNPESKDWTDQTGLRISYTPTTRQYDLGLLTIGVLEMGLIIPPKTFFTARGICPENATRRFITATDGLHVVSYSLHAHLLGRKIRVRHIRNGTQIGWLGKDEHYDFAYQQSRVFNTERIILPGDSLVTECGYDSSERESVSFGGRSTQEEMCFAFFAYYPRVKTVVCVSAVPPQSQALLFNATVAENGTVLSPATYRGKPFPALFRGTLWNDSVSQRFELATTMLPQVVATVSTNKTPVTEIYRYPVFQALRTEEGNCPTTSTTSTTSTTPATPATSTATTKKSRASSTCASFLLVMFTVLSVLLVHK